MELPDLDLERLEAVQRNTATAMGQLADDILHPSEKALGMMSATNAMLNLAHPTNGEGAALCVSLLAGLLIAHADETHRAAFAAAIANWALRLDAGQRKLLANVEPAGSA